MDILREEVKGTAATNDETVARSTSSYPDVGAITVRAEPTLMSAVDSAQTQRYLSGALPVAVAVRVPYPLAPLSLAPHGLQVTHQFSGPQRRFVRLEEYGVAEILITETGAHATTIELLARDHATASSLWDVIRNRVSSRLDENQVVRCQLWSAASYGAAGHDHKVKSSRWADVRRNYPRATAQQLDTLMALTDPEDDDGKLVLWHGPPGTGKTSAVRTLVTEWLPWCDAHLISDPEAFFTSPDYLLEVVNEAPRPDYREPLRGLDELAPRRWKVIICEDADEYLRSDARERSGPALGRLLNLTDGLLGEGARTLVVLTTNDSLGRIHPAVQRPGRCRATIEFPAMSAGDAAAWMPDGVAAPTGSATLAELFAMARGQEVREVKVRTGMYL